MKSDLAGDSEFSRTAFIYPDSPAVLPPGVSATARCIRQLPHQSHVTPGGDGTTVEIIVVTLTANRPAPAYPIIPVPAVTPIPAVIPIPEVTPADSKFRHAAVIYPDPPMVKSLGITASAAFIRQLPH